MFCERILLSETITCLALFSCCIVKYIFEKHSALFFRNIELIFVNYAFIG